MKVDDEGEGLRERDRGRGGGDREGGGCNMIGAREGRLSVRGKPMLLSKRQEFILYPLYQFLQLVPPFLCK